MNKTLFTQEQIDALRANPYTSYVSSKSIRFTQNFRSNFWDHYSQGESPSEIFRLLGYDPLVLGNSRIGNFTHKLSKEQDRLLRMTPAEENESLRHRVEALEFQVDVLKKALEMANSQKRRKS